MALAAVTLSDKYALETGRIYLSGIQALVIMQRRRDAALGLNTAGFISGYRGSPRSGAANIRRLPSRTFLEQRSARP